MREEVSREKGTGIEVRALTLADLEDIVRIDAVVSGHARAEYFRLKLQQAIQDTSVRMSLAAVVDGRVVGFLLGSVFFGDYGTLEPVATLDAIGVHPRSARTGVGSALWRQFVQNLRGMRIERLQTQVDWSQWELMTFFQRLGFAPGPRICIERTLGPETDE